MPAKDVGAPGPPERRVPMYRLFALIATVVAAVLAVADGLPGPR